MRWKHSHPFLDKEQKQEHELDIKQIGTNSTNEDTKKTKIFTHVFVNKRTLYVYFIYSYSFYQTK